LSNPTAGATIGPALNPPTVTIVDDESVTPGRLDLQFDPGSGADDTMFHHPLAGGQRFAHGWAFHDGERRLRNGIAR